MATPSTYVSLKGILLYLLTPHVKRLTLSVSLPLRRPEPVADHRFVFVVPADLHAFQLHLAPCLQFRLVVIGEEGKYSRPPLPQLDVALGMGHRVSRRRHLRDDA